MTEKQITLTGWVAAVVIAVTLVFACLWFAKYESIEVTRWCSWSSGRTRGCYPVAIKYEGVTYDCIPREDPSSAPSEFNTIGQARREAAYSLKKYERLTRLAEDMSETMELPRLKAQGAALREQAAHYIEWAEEAEKKAVKREAKIAKCTSCGRAEEE